MTFYEELGIEPDASEAEIRKSLRALSRMLNPDLHPEGKARQLAEVQMQRMSEMVETLCDRERRAEYDARIAGARPVEEIEGDPWWAWGLGLAVVSTMCWWLWLLVPDSRVSLIEEEPILLSAPGKPDVAARASVDGWMRRPKPEGLPGIWIYSMDSRDQPASWAYATESVELRLERRLSEYVGAYRSRIKMPDGGAAKELEFEFRGPATSEEFGWSRDGLRGRLRMRQLSENQLEASWRIVGEQTISGLAAGSVTLMRRQQ